MGDQPQRIVIDIESLYAEDGTAKLEKLPKYIAEAKAKAGNGNVVSLTGRGPIWLYLKVAHELHGVAMRLEYDSPVTGSVIIFDHNPH